MKQPENNEIESLLRGLARHGSATPADLAGKPKGAHLDADEMNAYAEGALPASTRARYTAHLVDCDNCRKIVGQLSLAAEPLTGRISTSRSSAPAGWREVLAAIFAPASLRYALPALVLIVVGVVFISTRRPPTDSMVAVNSRQAEWAVPSPQGLPAQDKINEATPPPQGETSRTVALKPGDAAARTEAKADKPTQTAKAEPLAKSTEQEAPKNEVAGQTQGVFAPEPAPPPAKPAAVSDESKDAGRASGVIETRSAAERKKEVDKQRAEKQDEERNQAKAGAPASDAAAAGRDDDRKKAKIENRAAVAGGGRDEQREETSETRTVAGRRFERRHSVWVDVAYNSSLTTISVSRGSEQYRALVADEPGIDTIVRQLTGEIILTWKGRAYRIR